MNIVPCVQASNDPLTVNSRIAAADPQQASQGFQGAIDNGRLPQQLSGIGLNYVPGSANVRPRSLHFAHPKPRAQGHNSLL